MPSLSLEQLPLFRAATLRDGPRTAPRETRCGYRELTGRLVELSGGRGTACLSFLCSLVLEAQSLGEPVVFVASGDSVFYPPDVAANGVDLDTLAVVRPSCIRDACRAAHHLLHSGAFGMVILDTGEESVPQGMLGRFAHLAEKNDTALVCVTERGLGSMVSLRVRTRLHRLAEGLFRCETEVIKDKRLGPGLSCPGPAPGSGEVYHAPAGLR